MIRADPQRPKATETEVGEIDSRPPFQSVKAAVSLFRDVTLPRSRFLSSEDMSEKETQLMLAEQEMERVQQSLETSQAAKARALTDLESAQRRAVNLRAKVDTAEKSKQFALHTKEAMNQRLEQLEIEQSCCTAQQNDELGSTRENYILVAADLDMAKQELAEVRHQFKLSMEAKLADLQKAEDELFQAMVNSERIKGMSNEISEMNAAIDRLKFEAQTKTAEAEKIAEESIAVRETYAAMNQEAADRLEDLRHDYDPQLRKNMEERLAEISADIEGLQEEIKHAQSIKLRDELNEAKSVMQQISDEERSYKSLVSSVMMELDRVQKQNRELKGKEAERQEFEEREWLEASRKVEEILSEAEKTRKDAEEMNKNVQELRREAEATRSVMTEAVKQLEVVLRAVEKAKGAEKRAMEDMRVLAEKQESLTHESDKKIRISLQDFEDLRGKREESERLVEFKAETVAAQLEGIEESRIEAEKKLEANLKALEEIQAATVIALRSAEIAEAAHSAVDAELRKWKPEA
ncbi:PREDICTED: putative WEB family protein At4g17210 [Tarenaya hassleriana]|uniref:putative WEB family protein At4g17210 n=1 Tax=Tarenaya hassleriana TaxID=28532 RepID=UPI00053C28D9|nr:PREDICTED: putative WEB family protein At4g17210 [Tarenaya hassleriana]